MFAYGFHPRILCARGNVNGYNAQNDNDLADTIVHRINDMLNEDGSVWGK
jgi:hypothetical protein